MDEADWAIWKLSFMTIDREGRIVHNILYETEDIIREFQYWGGD